MKGIKICRIFGINIEIHWSWFLVFMYFSYVLASQIFPKRVSEQSSVAYWLCGIITVLMLFVSVLVHELAHSRVAQLFKIPVKRITLLFFGGAAQIESLGKRAKEEFLIAIAGPVSSILMAVLFKFVSDYVHTNTKLVEAVLSYLFFINIVLAVFNLLPAYPMDGGRIFIKTPLWAILKNQLKATKIAGVVGQIFGVLMIIFGILSGAFWFLLIGGFLLLMAPAEYRQLVLKQKLEMRE